MPLPADLPRVPFSGIVHRVVRAGLDPLSTAGSLQAGGRYNAPGEFGAVYTSLEEATARVEVARALRQRGQDPGQYPDGFYWVYAMEVHLEAVLDLTDPAFLAPLGVNPEVLLSEAQTEPRKVAGEARRAGYQALIVPSAAVVGAKNLVIFVDLIAQQPRVVSSKPVSFRDAGGGR